MIPINTAQTTQRQESAQQQWEEFAEVNEYMSAVNPDMPSIEVISYPASLHQSGETRIIPFDASKSLKTPYPCTTPNLLANYLRICDGNTLKTDVKATSQTFYVIRGSGSTKMALGTIAWKEGDLFTLPNLESVLHTATSDTAIYWVHDAPLLTFLGVTPSVQRFEPVLYTKEKLTQELQSIREEAAGQNRTGILLANKNFPQTKTVTHTLWSLYNMLPANTTQKPHRHNSVAIDYCVSSGPDTYTMIGKEVDADGNIINPIKAMWAPGCTFVTPPGWWHSHHNDSDEDAIVLPIQDAGLLMNMQVLDFNLVK